MTDAVYLDHNATTPVDPRVADAMAPFLHGAFGNPSSSHRFGVRARVAVDNARGQVAEFLDCESDEIVFTGSGSEADHLAIRGIVLGGGLTGESRRSHVVTQCTEHPAVLQTCESLQRLHGCTVTYLPAGGDGTVDPSAFAEALSERTAVASIMHANAETGTIQSIAALASAAHDRGVPFHTDAAQSAGRLDVRVTELGVDLLTLVGHKMYAPKGIGVLYRRRGLRLEPVGYGGGQEHGLRSGTENVAGIVGLGEACRLLADRREAMAAARRRRDLLEDHLRALLPGRVHLNGSREQRLPNTLNVSIDGVIGNDVLGFTETVAASTGSACHAGESAPSAVLLAMGIPAERALGALRLTVGRWTTDDDVTTAAAAIADAVRRYDAEVTTVPSTTAGTAVARTHPAGR
ncbi:cysteine desulfurase family protein [Virgisporangium aurantiacum]